MSKSGDDRARLTRLACLFFALFVVSYFSTSIKACTSVYTCKLMSVPEMGSNIITVGHNLNYVIQLQLQFVIGNLITLPKTCNL